MIIDCIREGIHLTNRNVQLVYIRIVAAIINLAGMFVFLVFPVVLAAVYLGIDLSQAGELFPLFLNDPFEFISRYISLMLLVGASVFFYLLFTSFLYLFVLGGALGALRNAAVNIRFRFSLSAFFKAAGSNFSRLLRIALIICFVFVTLSIIIMISGGIASHFLNMLTGSESKVEIFFTSFTALSLVFLSIMALLTGIIFSMHSIVALIIEDKGVLDSVRKAGDFIKDTPSVFLFYIILGAGFVVLNLLLLGIRIPTGTDPVFGPALNIMLAIATAVLHSYLAIVVWSSLIVYYIKKTDYPVYNAGYEI